MRLSARWWVTPALLLPPVLLAVWVLTGGPWMSQDLNVYRSGADHILHGLPLYGPWPGLPFTYPPFAAVLLVPVDVVGQPAATILWVVVNWLTYLGFAGVLLSRLGVRRWWLAGALLAGLGFEPVWHNFALGQINLVLGLLIVLDTLVVPARWRGLGVGVAAGIKLTPAIFLIYFALRRDWGALVRTAIGFGATMAVGAVILPHDSWHYWTKVFYAADRVGDVAYVNNQSFHAVLMRLTHRADPPVVLGAIATVLAVVLATFAARAQLRRGHPVAGLVCVAIAGTLVSPIAWTHHWIWLIPAAAVLLVQRRYVAGGLVAATAIVAPMRWLPKVPVQELHFAWWQQLIAAAYVVAGVAFLILMLTGTQTAESPRQKPRALDQIS